MVRYSSERTAEDWHDHEQIKTNHTHLSSRLSYHLLLLLVLLCVLVLFSPSCFRPPFVLGVYTYASSLSHPKSNLPIESNNPPTYLPYLNVFALIVVTSDPPLNLFSYLVLVVVPPENESWFWIVKQTVWVNLSKVNNNGGTGPSGANGAGSCGDFGWRRRWQRLECQSIRTSAIFVASLASYSSVHQSKAFFQ